MTRPPQPPDPPRLAAPYGFSVYLAAPSRDAARECTPLLEQALAAIEWPPGVRVNGVYPPRPMGGNKTKRSATA